jgi:acetyl-CoA carboxylase biotin carboxylase subunit
MFSRLLVANRGEIAVRIIRACRELGVGTAAVYSDADAGALHVTLADRAVRLGPPPAADSYLAGERIVAAARECGAEAVHPGYGFLSENPSFAAACADAGLAFVGPPAPVMARMASKIEARRLMREHGVPVVPGEAPADQSDAALTAAVQSVGFPALLKPSAGGGGIGMRVVREAHEIATALERARRESLAAFGDATLYVERLVERPRHVEVQILGDRDGNVVHLFDRECSLQRRHQKVIEESPSPALTPALRARMGEAAVAAARAAGYVNAGTIEFLLEGRGEDARFYFLEMNTRLQVEHPVTECVTGIDLVQAQIRIAAGEPLPASVRSATLRGHAIECRVYAEDPARDFLPQAGRILLYREPRAPGVRVDSGVADGSDVPVHYDPLLAKLIVQADTRSAALARAREALRQFAVLGIRTNIPYLLAVLRQPDVEAGEIDTGWLDRETPALCEALAAEDAAPEALAAAARHDSAPAVGGAARNAARADPWESLSGWRGLR